MPIFPYECRNCGLREERLVPRFDTPVTCSRCGSADMTKLPARPGAVGSRTPCSGAHACPAAGSGHCCSGHCGCHE